MVVANDLGWKQFQMDVKNAFLIVILKRKLYAAIPAIFFFPWQVCRLRDGLKQRLEYGYLVLLLVLLAFHQALSGLLSLFESMIVELSCFCFCWCMIITGLIYLAFQGLNHISRTISDERSWHSQFLRTWSPLKWWLPLSHCGKKICFWPSFSCRLTKTAVISTHIEPNAPFTPLGCRRLDHPTLHRQLVRNLIYLIVTRLILHVLSSSWSIHLSSLYY